MRWGLPSLSAPSFNDSQHPTDSPLAGPTVYGPTPTFLHLSTALRIPLEFKASFKLLPTCYIPRPFFHLCPQVKLKHQIHPVLSYSHEHPDNKAELEQTAWPEQCHHEVTLTTTTVWAFRSAWHPTLSPQSIQHSLLHRHFFKLAFGANFPSTPPSTLLAGNRERKRLGIRRMSSMPTKPPNLPILPLFLPPAQGERLLPSSRLKSPPHLKDPLLRAPSSPSSCPASSTSPSLVTLLSTFKVLNLLIPSIKQAFPHPLVPASHHRARGLRS